MEEGPSETRSGARRCSVTRVIEWTWSRAREVSVERDTVRIALAAHVSDEGKLELELTLTSSTPAFREVEHRFTNVLLFLFALAVDRRSVVKEFTDWGRRGGGSGPMALISDARGGTKRWRVRVDTSSLAAVAGLGDRPARLAIVAAFSDSQHDGLWHQGEGNPPDRRGVLVRSEPVSLTWDGRRFAR